MKFESCFRVFKFNPQTEIKCYLHFQKYCIICHGFLCFHDFSTKMEENATSDFENILVSVYTITNDPFFSTLGFQPQCLSNKLPVKADDPDSNLIVMARNFHTIPVDAALHCVIMTLLIFIVINLLCKLLLYVLM